MGGGGGSLDLFIPRPNVATLNKYLFSFPLLIVSLIGLLRTGAKPGCQGDFQDPSSNPHSSKNASK